MAERKVTFPIIPDDGMLEKETRVIMTNEQLLTKNPSEQMERSFNDAPARTGGLGQNTGVKPRVSYSSQHRPLNGVHTGVSSFDKEIKKTSVEESRERVQRAKASVPQSKVKPYVHPLQRGKDDPSLRRFAGAQSQVSQKRPLGNVPDKTPKRPATDTKQSEDYFKSKRDSLFDRGL